MRNVYHFIHKAHRPVFAIIPHLWYDKAQNTERECSLVKENALYYGDNLDVMRRYLKDETVDLIYLDPPFNSSQDYNVLFAEQDGTRSAAQIKAFGDTWQ